MGPYEYKQLEEAVRKCEIDPDVTLFLMDESDATEPYLKIPLGDNPFFDGYLILHEEGWFIHRLPEK